LDIDNLPDVEEVGAAINHIKNGTAARNNGIIPELYKWGGQQLTLKIQQCFEQIWEGRADFPEAWKTANVVILYKGKGSKKDLNNYRGIFLLDVGGKIMARIIANRLMPHLERIMDDCRFRLMPNLHMRLASSERCKNSQDTAISTCMQYLSTLKRHSTACPGKFSGTAFKEWEYRVAY